MQLALFCTARNGSINPQGRWNCFVLWIITIKENKQVRNRYLYLCRPKLLIDHCSSSQSLSLLFFPLAFARCAQTFLFGCIIALLLVFVVGGDLCSRYGRGYSHVIVSSVTEYSDTFEFNTETRKSVCFSVFKKMSNSLMKTHIRVAKWPYWHFFLPNTDKNVVNVKAL